ncbi:sensor histidine kinase [Gordonia phthalatica]|uniref:Oxygen sensor histidine kinase NreB n=1 Tax=Gordonia phthalatica TaxID=1136941 RepID=A0A0N9NBC8_9ACTN|nr:histidine kinase [Gordonia phthalatica]ALG84901.1 histidine kinase [Gordonia phthalatica]
MTALLAPVRRLDVWLFVVLVVLVVTSSVRYVLRHGLGTVGVLILLGAVVLVAGYGVRPWLPERSWVPAAWSVTLAALVAALTVVAPSFAWCAVPVAFAVLGTLPFRWAVACVSVLMVVITASWLRISSAFDPALIAGPLGIALITVMAFRALDRESKARADLIDRLVATQDDLAAEQRRAGALRERARLSRDIHDSVGQDLSSVYLLLQVADRGWKTQPQDSHDNVRTAIDASRRGLEEIRHVIHDLSTDVESSTLTSPSELHRRLDDVGERSHGPATVTLRVDGTAVPLSHRLSSALVATARGALANAQEHAGANRVMMTLTYTDDEVRLDIRDDGRGFDVDRVLAAQSGSTRAGGRSQRGLGLKGVSDRVVDLGGGAMIESEIGDGTTVSVWFPIGVPHEEQ